MRESTSTKFERLACLLFLSANTALYYVTLLSLPLLLGVGQVMIPRSFTHHGCTAFWSHWLAFTW